MQAHIKCDLVSKGIPEELHDDIYQAVVDNGDMSVQSYIVLYVHYFTEHQVEENEGWIKSKLKNEWFPNLH